MAQTPPTLLRTNSYNKRQRTAYNDIRLQKEIEDCDARMAGKKKTYLTYISELACCLLAREVRQMFSDLERDEEVKQLLDGLFDFDLPIRSSATPSATPSATEMTASEVSAELGFNVPAGVYYEAS